MLARRKIGPADLRLYSACATNEDALDFLADTFAIPEAERTCRGRLRAWTEGQARVVAEGAVTSPA